MPGATPFIDPMLTMAPVAAGGLDGSGDGAGDEERAGEVDVDHRAPVVDRQVGERAEPDQPGVVHGDVGRAELVDDAGDLRPRR